MTKPLDPRHLAPTGVDRTADFIVTKEYRRFAEFCDAVRRNRYIGLCYGPPGVGKTLSARRYANWDQLGALIPRYTALIDPDATLPTEVSTCRTILYTPTVDNTPGRVGRDIDLLRCSLSFLLEDVTSAQAGHPARMHPPDWTELLIVDEADRLRMSGLEQLRDIYDRAALGLILIGMPGLEKRLARYPQLYSRVGFVHPFRPLSPEEVRFILEKKWEQLGLPLDPSDFADAEAVAAIIRITGGNFRLIQRLLTQVDRILQINQLHLVTQEVIEVARESLVVGIV